MIQGVREVFDIVDLNLNNPREEEEVGNANGNADGQGQENGNANGKIVLIGRGIADLPFEQSLRFAVFS